MTVLIIAAHLILEYCFRIHRAETKLAHACYKSVVASWRTRGRSASYYHSTYHVRLICLYHAENKRRAFTVEIEGQQGGLGIEGFTLHRS